jgi:hypothetical protein
VKLSNRALSYLSTRERRPYIKDEPRLRDAIAATGAPEIDWLVEIHLMFAGYVEPLGSNDEAVYGILHDSSRWLGAEGIDWDLENDGEWAGIACADAHPSWEFWLSSDRSFAGSGLRLGAADSFVHKIERDAVFWDFSRRGRNLYVHPVYPTQRAALAAMLVSRLSDSEVAEATDSRNRTFLTEDLLLWQAREEGLVARNLILVLADAKPAALADLPWWASDDWMLPAQR